MHPLLLFLFGFDSNLNIYLSLCRALIILPHLGKRTSNTAEELVYNNLYHEE